MKNKIPKFKSLEQERKFWDTHSITDFLDELAPVDVNFVKEKKRLVSIRLDSSQIAAVKKIASQKGLGYLTLIRAWIAKHILEEDRSAGNHKVHVN